MDKRNLLDGLTLEEYVKRLEEIQDAHYEEDCESRLSYLAFKERMGLS